MNPTRRDWLTTYLALPLLPGVLAAHQHAMRMLSSGSNHFDYLGVETAADVAALASQIIPSTDGPGASEAGVVFFIDRALASFASDRREEFESGLRETAHRSQELFPSSASIHSLTLAQQQQLMASIETGPFFELLRTLTVLGFLGDPSYGGNRNQVGWKQIGFEPSMSYQHPFGYYDQPSAETQG